MGRRELIAFATAVWLAWPWLARAQEQAKGARLGFLGLGDPAAAASRVEALRAGLRDLGYVEGKSLVIEFRWSRTVEQMPEAAAELARMKNTVVEYEGAFGTMVRDRVGAVLVHASTQTAREGARPLAELAQKHRLPTMFGVRDNVAAGGLMSYAPDPNDLWRRAAVYIDKILKGAKPAELPIDQASKYQLVINRKTASALGLAIPPSMLARADEVLE